MPRTIIFALFLVLFFSACKQKPTPEPLYLQSLQEEGFGLREELRPFYFGVASGDPATNSVLLWTCVTPDYHQSVKVGWKIGTDEEFKNVVQRGKVTTDSLGGYTVKVVPDELEPGTRYYYQFEALGGKSPIGRTNTLPEGSLDSLYLAFASCSNYQFGYFNAYDRMADNDDIFAVIHLGDYIYEHGIGGYGDTSYGRFHIPPHEITTWSDYWKRYAQYRTDPSLQRAHQMHPFITVWDDHEFTNNAYDAGAENHQPDKEGSWEVRKEAAVKAYFEWLPVRDVYKPFLYRDFSIGDLADLVMLEGRLHRSEQAESFKDSILENSERTMLGSKQVDWLKKKFKESDAKWRILGNQVLFTHFNVDHIPQNQEWFLDMWSGYPAEQKDLTQFLQQEQIENMLIFTGDFHSSFSAEVTLDALNKSIYDPENGKTGLATEFVVQSINSSNFDEYTTTDTCQMAEQMYADPAYNPHVKYANVRDHGFVLLKLYQEEAIVEYHYVESLSERNDRDKEVVVFRVKSNEPIIIRR